MKIPNFMRGVIRSNDNSEAMINTDEISSVVVKESGVIEYTLKNGTVFYRCDECLDGKHADDLLKEENNICEWVKNNDDFYLDRHRVVEQDGEYGVTVSGKVFTEED